MELEGGWLDNWWRLREHVWEGKRELYVFGDGEGEVFGLWGGAFCAVGGCVEED